MTHEIYDLCKRCQKDCKKRRYRTEVLDCCIDFVRIKRKKKEANMPYKGGGQKSNSKAHYISGNKRK